MKSGSKNKLNKGLTLVELLVAVGIFTIVMFVAVGGLLRIISANQQAQAIKSVMNNLNFSLESLTRSMRMGAKYHCGEISLNTTTAENLVPNDCYDTGGNAVAYVASSGDLVYYRLANGRIERTIKSGNNASTALFVTSPEMQIDRFNFYVNGAQDQSLPSEARITLGGKAKVGSKIETRFDLQTFVTQRYRDFDPKK